MHLAPFVAAAAVLTVCAAPGIELYQGAAQGMTPEQVAPLFPGLARSTASIGAAETWSVEKTVAHYPAAVEFNFDDQRRLDAVVLDFDASGALPLAEGDSAYKALRLALSSKYGPPADCAGEEEPLQSAECDWRSPAGALVKLSLLDAGAEALLHVIYKAPDQGEL